MHTYMNKILMLPLLAGALIFTASASSKTVEIPDGPAEAIKFIMTEMADGNGGVLWQAMPASYQSDVNSIAQLAGTKIDAEIYDKVFATLNRVSTVLDKQKEFLFNMSMGGEPTDPDEVAKMRKAWPSIMNIFAEISSSSLSSASGLQGFDGKTFFGKTVSAIIKDMDAISMLQGETDEPSIADLKQAEVKLVEGTDEVATLEMSVPGEEPETETFVKVEGRWVPQEMAEGWTEQMAEAKATLEAIDPTQLAKQKPQIMGVFAMIDGVLAQIEAAETQEQFNQAVQGAMMPLMGAAMMFQGMGGGDAPGGMAPMPMAPPPAPDSTSGF